MVIFSLIFSSGVVGAAGGDTDWEENEEEGGEAG